MSDLRSSLKTLHKLGAGHFGEVFLGDDPVHGPVAVKVIEKASYLLNNPGHTDIQWNFYKVNFRKEAQFLSKATHRNVVQVHHIVESVTGDEVQICMAYCPGGSLNTRFDHGPMLLSEVRKLAAEVLMGLQALHARQMLHRDIKPGNILLDRYGVAQISDFGLVTDDLVFGYGSQAGYSDHLAYEIWHGESTSVRSDIWAFGMTLYRLLHGKNWYDESPPPKDVIKHGGFVDSLKWLPHIPKSWRTVIRKMLADKQGDRYQNASQALNAINKLDVQTDWHTSVSSDLIRWHLPGVKRIRIVEWKRLPARKHEWKAWTEPTGVGQNKTIAGSGGIVGRGKAIAELKAFFQG